MSTAYCSCKPGHKVGWKHLWGEWWVCGSCEQPTHMWLEKTLTSGGTTLNLFRYGPHHNDVWTNERFLHPGDEAAWITEYAWTDETVTGAESGRVARVWVHSSALSEKVDTEGVHAQDA